MQTRVDRHYFKRTDFGSFGWLDKIPGDLWEVWFFSGVDPLTASFRMDEGTKLSPQYLTQPIFQWIDGLDVVWDVPFFSATNAQTKSFRSNEQVKLSSQLQVTSEFFGWLGKVPLGLLEVADYVAAWYTQSASFRSLGRKRLEHYHMTQPEFSWLKEPLGLTDISAWTNIIIEGNNSIDGKFYQITGRYRVR